MIVRLLVTFHLFLGLAKRTIVLGATTNPLRTVKRVFYGTFDTVSNIPSFFNHFNNKVSNTATATKVSMSRTINTVQDTAGSIATIPATIEDITSDVNTAIDSNIKNVLKLTEELVDFLEALPDTFDSNVKVVSAIPNDISKKFDTDVKTVQSTTNEIITRTNNFPTFISNSVNSTITSFHENINRKITATKKAANRVKSFFLAPIIFTQKVAAKVKELEEGKDVFAMDEEQLKALMEKAAIRKAKSNRIQSLKSAKEAVYMAFDAVEHAFLEVKNTPDKIEKIKLAVRKKSGEIVASYQLFVAEIRSIPERIRAFGHTLALAVEEVKRAPANIEKTIEAGMLSMQKDVEQTQLAASKMSEYIVRVVTLEEAKDAYKNAEKKVEEIQIQWEQTQAFMKNPASYLASKNQSVAVSSPLDGFLSTVASVGQTLNATVGALEFVQKTVKGIAGDEYVQYLFSRVDTSAAKPHAETTSLHARECTHIQVDPSMPVTPPSTTKQKKVSADVNPIASDVFQAKSSSPLAPADTVNEPEATTSTSSDTVSTVTAATTTTVPNKVSLPDFPANEPAKVSAVKGSGPRTATTLGSKAPALIKINPNIMAQTPPKNLDDPASPPANTAV